jgi:uncharacterized protein (TIGR03435 family)
MVRSALSLLLVAALAAPLGGQSLEFEVASIKRNTNATPTPTSGPPPSPGSGQMTIAWIPARFLATRAYPDLTTPIIVEGLPAWADSERYDVTVKFRPGATAAEQAEMWKTLLADRMKLQAHYETRLRPAYKLVFARADRRFGPQLKPSSLNCPPADSTTRQQPSLEARDAMMATIRERRAATPQEEAALLSQCRGTFNAWNTIYAGATEIRGLIQSLSLFHRLDRPVINETGLEGLYSVKLWAEPPGMAPPTGNGAAGVPTLADAPSIFSALQDQLGLKLEPTTIEGRVLVVDHIERPTEN